MSTADLAAEPEVLAPGDGLLPGHTVVSHVRRGNRLDVYDVWSTERQARCIVKVVRPDRVEERHTGILLRREGELLRDLAHPHLVRAYDVVESPRVAVVMETLTGPSLGQVLDDRGRLAVQDVALLGVQTASALRYLHRHGWVHGDVTPGNLVLESGTVKVIDLSLSGPPGPVRRGSGTRGYRSPEQTAGADQSPATDVWGLGAVLHHAMTGATHDERPRTRWVSPRTVRGRFGNRSVLMSLVRECLRTEPGQRVTLAEVSTTLERIVDVREV